MTHANYYAATNESHRAVGSHVFNWNAAVTRPLAAAKPISMTQHPSSSEALANGEVGR